MSIKIYHPYGDEVNKVTVDASKPVLTKQSEEKAANINNIVAKFVKTGQTPVLPPDTTFGFAPDMTYHEAMNKIVNTDEYFMKLPAAARNKFENDPGAFLAFIDNPENEDDLREMGLLAPVETAEPVVEAEPAAEPPQEPITPT